MASDEKKSNRTRNYACMVYPESAPENWLDILAEQLVPAFVSPLHDKDIDPQNQPKKPHYHVMLMFDGVKTGEQVKEIFDLIGGVGMEVVKNTRSYARYLCHLDNPDKARYQEDEVRCFGGSDYAHIIGLPSDKYKAIMEMMDYCDEKGIYSYAALLRYARREHGDWFRVLCDSGTIAMKEYLKTKYWEVKNCEELKVLAEMSANGVIPGN